MIKPTYEDFSKIEKICLIIYLRSLMMNQFYDKSKFEARTIHLFEYIKAFSLSMDDLTIFSRQNHPFSIPTTINTMSTKRKEKIAFTVAGLLYCDGRPTDLEVTTVIGDVSKIIDKSILLKTLTKYC